MHLECALWAPEVYEDRDGELNGLASAVRRGRHMRCRVCKDKGATIGCHNVTCASVYHLQCAERADLFLHPDTFAVMCQRHAPMRHRNLLKAKYSGKPSAKASAVAALSAASGAGTLHAHKRATTGALVDEWRESRYLGKRGRAQEVNEMGIFGDREEFEAAAELAADEDETLAAAAPVAVKPKGKGGRPSNASRAAAAAAAAAQAESDGDDGDNESDD